MARTAWWSALVAAAVIAGLGGRRVVAAEVAEGNGRQLYRLHCAACHGAGGRGDGPDAAVFAPPPRNLRDNWLAQHDTEELVRRVREGLPLALTLDLATLRARAGEVEAIVAYLKHLPSVDWRAVERGRAIYVDRCALCHGHSGRPTAALPAGVRSPCDLSDLACQRSIGDKQLTTAVRHGYEHMPALTPRIPKADAPPLAAFVRLLSPGYELYTRYCTGCHGDNGRGRSGLAETMKLPTVVFDRSYFKRRDPEQLRAAVWHMVTEQKPSMPHYRYALSELQARAIIEYLRGSE